jgi:hypothetical protein
MDAALIDLLQRQQRDGFPDLAGAEIAATIPISERLINEAVARTLPPGGKVRSVLVMVEDGNQVTAEIRLSGPRFLPAIPMTFAIEDQPQLPDRPTLGLRLAKASGLVGMIASLFPSVASLLPPGVAMDGDRILIDIRRLLIERNLESWLAYVTDLRVNTRAGAVVLDVRARIGPR